MAKRKLMQEELTIMDTSSKKAKTDDEEGSGISLRRSTRLCVKRDFSADAVSRRKRQKDKQVEKPMTKRRITSIVGRLDKLMEIPLDIFCLIATNLGPQDLLNMSRATKTLRALLMSRESKPIWRAARQNMGMPECPPDLSEPKYADLMFYKGCYLCDSPRAQTLHFALRLRLCKPCSEKNVCPIYRIHGFEIVDPTEESVFDLVPTQACIYPTASLCYIGEVEKTWLQYHSSDLSPEGRKQYAEERKRLVGRIRENAAEVDRWMVRRRVQKSQEQNAIATSREQSIHAKLREKGFSEMDLDASLDTGPLRSKWRKLVKEPKPLTDRIWNRIELQLRSLILLRREWRAQLELALDSWLDYSDEDYEEDYYDNYSDDDEDDYFNPYDWEAPFLYLPFVGHGSARSD